MFQNLLRFIELCLHLQGSSNGKVHFMGNVFRRLILTIGTRKASLSNRNALQLNVTFTSLIHISRYLKCVQELQNRKEMNED